MAYNIYLIDNNDEIYKCITKLFQREKEYKIHKAKTNEIEGVLKDIPSLIIINEDGVDEDTIKICDSIRGDENNIITPIIVISSNHNKDHRVKILKAGVEHYIKAPIDEEYMYYTIVNAIRLLYTNRGISPLTGLPGNIQIQTEMKRRLLNKEDFCVIYLDLDNFKAYNDVYGFLNGDEIIKFTAKTIMNNINSNDCEDCFVGHIGGDDFVAMITGMNCEKICQNIVIEFDEGVKRFFTRTDLDKGYIEVPNRKGVIEQFPITSISIGVVVSDKGRFKSTLEIGEVAAQVKHLAKTTFGSTYVIDRRNK